MINKEKAIEMFMKYFDEYSEKSRYNVDGIEDYETDYWWLLVSNETGACLIETFPAINKKTGEFVKFELPVPA